MSKHEWYENEQSAGNGTVNDGPDRSPDDTGRPSDGPDTDAVDRDAVDANTVDTGAFDLGSDELALRRLMQHAVQNIEPVDGSLDQLRRAVPARRARKRQALVGAAAAALLIGTAIPALVHVSQTGGSGDDRTSIAGHGEETQGGTGRGKGTDSDRKDTDDPSDRASSAGKGEKKDKPGDTGKGSGTTAGTGNPSGTTATTAPACGTAELGNATSLAGTPDAEGKVYGTFRVTNVSGGVCTVQGGGSVSTAVSGAADQGKITTATHTAGDPATGLPAPSAAAAPVLLQPGSSYEVRFAWVPSASCPPGGGSTGGPSPDPSPSEGGSAGAAGGAGGATGDQGTSTQLYRADGGTADGSVTVSHTAEPGGPSTGTTIPNACAGTVYYTGALPASS
ncbi:hypothetical protein ACIQNU_15835 [Streptomyces sp. NPDC091292]|uniref:hypothetical protein n=1 Tax=Streptomyces sp. NPDC091292 TaxID=3365991 RepID=UPI00381121E2